MISKEKSVKVSTILQIISKIGERCHSAKAEDLLLRSFVNSSDSRLLM